MPNLSINEKTAVLFLILTVVITFFTILLLFIRFYSYSQKIKKLLNVRKVFIYIVGIFLALYCLHISGAFFVKDNPEINYVIGTDVFDFFINIGITIQHFFAGASYGESLLSLEAFSSPCLYYLYNITYIVLAVLSIFAGISVIVDLIKDWAPKIHLVFNFKQKRYLFSALNETSIDIATKIFVERKRYDYFIVFFNTSNATNSLLYKAKSIGAICLKENINDVYVDCICCIRKLLNIFGFIFRWIFNHNAKMKTVETILWFIDYDVRINNTDAIGLATNIKLRPLFYKMNKISVFISNHTSDLDLEISKFYKEKFSKKIYDKMYLSISNEWRNLVYNLIFENETALYNYITYEKDKEGRTLKATLSIVIIGSGYIGKEFFKACAWIGQLGTDIYDPNTNKTEYKLIDLDIHIISKKEEEAIEEQFKVEMPGLFGEQYGKTLVKPTFHPFMFGTNDFDDKVSEIIKNNNPKYFLISLGNDELNYNCSCKVGKLLLKENNNIIKEKVLINYFIDDTEYYRAIKHVGENIKLEELPDLNLKYNCISNMDLADRNYSFYDDYCFFFSESMYNLAYIVNSIYDRINGWKSSHKAFRENYNSVYSSISSVIHAKYKCYMLGLLDEFEKFYKEYNLIPVQNKFSESVCKNKHKWAYMEHAKWAAYNYCEGFVTAKNSHVVDYLIPISISKRETVTKHKFAKIHINLVESKFSGGIEENIITLINKLFKEKTTLIDGKAKELAEKLQNIMSDSKDEFFATWVENYFNELFADIITTDDLTIIECEKIGKISLSLINQLDDLDKTNLIFEYACGNMDEKDVAKFKTKDLDFIKIGELNNAKK